MEETLATPRTNDLGGPLPPLSGLTDAGAARASSEVVISGIPRRGRSRRPPRADQQPQSEAQNRASSDQSARLPKIMLASSIPVSAKKRASSMDVVLSTNDAEVTAENGVALEVGSDLDSAEVEIHNHDHDHDELTRFLGKKASSKELPPASPENATLTEKNSTKARVRIASKDVVERASSKGKISRGFRKSLEADFRMRLELDAKRGRSAGFAKWYELDNDTAAHLDLGRCPRWRSEDSKLQSSAENVTVNGNNLDAFQVKHRAKQSKGKTDVRKEAEREQRITTSSVKTHLQAMGGQRQEMRELRQSMHSVLRSTNNLSIETVANSSFMSAGTGVGQAAEAAAASPVSPTSPRAIVGVS